MEKTRETKVGDVVFHADANGPAIVMALGKKNKVGDVVFHADANGPVIVMALGKKNFLGAYLDAIQSVTNLDIPTKLRQRRLEALPDDNLGDLGWSWFSNDRIWGRSIQVADHLPHPDVAIKTLKKKVEESDIAEQIKKRPAKLGRVSKDKLKICSEGLMINLGGDNFVLVEMSETELKDHAMLTFRTRNKMMLDAIRSKKEAIRTAALSPPAPF